MFLTFPTAQTLRRFVLGIVLAIAAFIANVYRKHYALEDDIKKRTRGMLVKDFRKITPIIGELSMVLDNLVYQDANIPKLGQLFVTMLMGEPHIVLGNNDLLDQVFYRNAKNITNEPNESYAKLFGRNSIIVSEGEKHKSDRRTIINYVGVPALNRLFTRFIDIFAKRIDSWVQKTSDGSYVDLLTEVQEGLWAAVSIVALGDDVSKKVVDELNDIMLEYGEGVFSIPIDLPFTTFGKALMAKQRFKEVLVDEFKRRQAMPDRGVNREDLFQALINDPTSKDYPEGFNPDNALTIIWASLDTTKSAILYMIDSMIDHAKEWERVNQDLQAAFGPEGIRAPGIVYAELQQKVPYLMACVKECVRSRVGAMTIRKAIEDIEIEYKGKRYLAPKGYKFYACTYYAAKDPESKVFNYATSFIPERFLGENAEDKVSAFKSGLSPFGLGDRYCPGNPLALMEMQVFMALMSKFRWTRREKIQKWVTKPVPTPPEGFWVRAEATKY